MSKSQTNRDRIARPKGRALDDEALVEVREAIAGIAQRRDLLIEMLHRLQDRYRCISARHTRALAEILRLSEAEIFEVASFYHHFDLMKDGTTAPPEITIRVCESVSCMLAGAETLVSELAKVADPATIRPRKEKWLQCD